MKKILIFALTAIILVTSLFCIVGARDEDNYIYVWEFQETTKAYPVMNSIEDCIGLKSYYQTNNFNFSGYTEDHGEMQVNIECTSTGILIDVFMLTGSYPTYDYVLESNTYNDVGFILGNGIEIIGFIDGVPNYVTSLADITGFFEGTNYLTNKNFMREGYYVSFPINQEQVMNDNIIGTISSSLGSFILGIGSAFPTAFQSVFITNGALNALSIFLLVLFGCALAYGCVRWITGLFRKESN